MGFHTFDPEKAERLDDAARRYRYLSREELLAALDPSPDAVLADLGSGTGFYTDDVAPHAGRVYAVDIQDAMHDRYREKGVPGNVELVTSAIADLPVETGQLDAAFSTMTYHEFTDDDALAEVARTLQSGGRFVVVDWSANGEGERGPPVSERYTGEEARTQLEDAGFDVVEERTRLETFLVGAHAP